MTKQEIKKTIEDLIETKILTDKKRDIEEISIKNLKVVAVADIKIKEKGKNSYQYKNCIYPLFPKM